MSEPNRPAVPADGDYCDQCGNPTGGPGHRGCADRRALEPPRYCPGCGRRMVVQVVPTGWTATCSRHGAIHS